MDPITGVTVDSPSAPADALPDFKTMPKSDFDKYLQTGELPKVEPKETKTDVIADATDKSGTTSEVVKKDAQTQQAPKPLNREERRNKFLNDENKVLRERLEALEKAKTTEPVKTSEKTAVTDDPNEPNIDALNPDGTPKYKSVLDWSRDFKKYLIETGIKPAVAEAMRADREAAEQKQQQTESQKATDKLANSFVKRVSEYRKTLTEDTFVDDYAEMHGYLKKTNAPREIGDFILDSESGPQLVTYFGENFEEFEKLTALPLHAALRELGRLEISEKVKGPAPKTRTGAKKIGESVSGSVAVSDDDEAIQKAAESGNMKEYDRLMKKAGL